MILGCGSGCLAPVSLPKCRPFEVAPRAAFPLRHPYLEASIERAQGCLDLVDSRCVMQVEQPIDLH